MKKLTLIVILVILGGGYWFMSLQVNYPRESDRAEAVGGGEISEAPADGGGVKVIGEAKDDLSSQFMVDYGVPELPAQEDLFRVSEMLESYFSLVKSDSSLPVGENRDLTAALVGGNPYRIRFLSSGSPWVNAKGELIDRWNTPLYFHAISADRIGVRSAGPDRKMWSADDVIDGEDALPFLEIN